MKKSESPPLNLSSLLSIIERGDSQDEPGQAPNERLKALQTWKKSLEKRDELARSYEQLRQGTDGGAPRSRTSVLGPATPAGVRILESTPRPTLTETFLAAGDNGGRRAEHRSLDQAKLTRAREVAHVGSVLPDFPYYGRVKRFLARVTARGVFFLSGVLTAHQRIYNNALLDMVTESAANLDHQAARLDHLVHAVHRLAAGIDEGFSAKQTEIHHLHSALDSLTGKLEKASMQAMEQELRMAEADCERSWLQLAELEQRAESLSLTERLEQLETPGNGASSFPPTTGFPSLANDVPREVPNSGRALDQDVERLQHQQATQKADLEEVTERLGRLETIAGDLGPLEEIHQIHDLTLKGFHQRLGWLEELPKQLESQAQARVALDGRLGQTEQRLGRLEEYLQENLQALHQAQQSHGMQLSQLVERLKRLEARGESAESRRKSRPDNL